MNVAVSRARRGARREPLELFFDLVYVFAIGQLSHHLLEHVDLRTGAETAILTLAVPSTYRCVQGDVAGSRPAPAVGPEGPTLRISADFDGWGVRAPVRREHK